MSSDILQRHNVKVIGHGQPAVVLAHGFGCDQRMWRFIAPELARHHQVVLFDYMGCGQSDIRHWTPAHYQSLGDHARDLNEIIDALGLSRVVLIGHSMSASIGVLACVARPELYQRLIQIGPNPCFINQGEYVGGFERADIMDLLDLMDRNMIGWANFFAPFAMKNDDRPELGDELKRSICQGEPDIVKQLARQVFMADVRAWLPKVSVPSVILQCADDTVAPPSVGDYLQQHLPDAVLHRLRATGHCPHMSHPEETLAVLMQDRGQWV